MLDPALWTLGEAGIPTAVFPRSFAAASTGDSGVLLIEYAETFDAIETGPWKTIQLYVNKRLAEHFHSFIDAATEG
jgi:ABC-type phosphate/phosphonate transport system permease subunit